MYCHISKYLFPVLKYNIAPMSKLCCANCLSYGKNGCRFVDSTLAIRIPTKREFQILLADDEVTCRL